MYVCYGLNVCAPPNLYVESLTRLVMIYGDRAFGTLGLNEVMRVGP